MPCKVSGPRDNAFLRSTNSLANPRATGLIHDTARDASTLLGPRKRGEKRWNIGHGSAEARNHGVSPHFRNLTQLSLVNRSRLISPTSRWHPAENSHPRFITRRRIRPVPINRGKPSRGFRSREDAIPSRIFPFAKEWKYRCGNK